MLRRRQGMTGTRGEKLREEKVAARVWNASCFGEPNERTMTCGCSHVTWHAASSRLCKRDLGA